MTVKDLKDRLGRDDVSDYMPVHLLIEDSRGVYETDREPSVDGYAIAAYTCRTSTPEGFRTIFWIDAYYDD